MEMSGKWNSDEICIDEKTNGMTKIASKKKKKKKRGKNRKKWKSQNVLKSTRVSGVNTKRVS
jgi:hypothetical protein